MRVFRCPRCGVLIVTTDPTVTPERVAAACEQEKEGG
jgi:hypothetical protein